MTWATDIARNFRREAEAAVPGELLGIAPKLLLDAADALESAHEANVNCNRNVDYLAARLAAAEFVVEVARWAMVGWVGGGGGVTLAREANGLRTALAAYETAKAVSSPANTDDTQSGQPR